MRLYRIAQLHRIAGLSLGAVLFILALSGFFLDHENFNFLWETSFDKYTLPQAIGKKIPSTFTSFKVNTDDNRHFIAGSRMGLYLSTDQGKNYLKTLDRQVFTIEPERLSSRENYYQLYVGTTDGIYQSADGGFNWTALALQGEPVESLSYFNKQLYAVVDKRAVYKVDVVDASVKKLSLAPLSDDVLPTQVSLGRLIRDLHYGRGLFSGDSSLLINDYSAGVLVFLSISGLTMYLLTRRIRHRKSHNKKLLFVWRAVHSNSLILISFIPILLLLITGVFLDHPDFFRSLMRETKLSTQYLPPVYRDLSTDIWGLDFDGKDFRLGNRLGVFKSADLKNWSLENRGFAWRFTRLGDELYVSGMGSPNRMLSADQWKNLRATPHMPRDVFRQDGKLYYFTRKPDPQHSLPDVERASLYLVLLGLHDGEFFHPLWVFVNDLAAIAMLLLLFTGYIKWRRKNLSRKTREVNQRLFFLKQSRQGRVNQ